MNRYILQLITLLIVLGTQGLNAPTLLAQNKKEKIKAGDESFSEKFYYDASKYYKEAIDLGADQLYIKYKYAESLRLYNEYNMAENIYAQVLAADQGEHFPECMFWLAMMQKQNGRYDKALKTFENVSNIHSTDTSSYVYIKSRKEIESCKFAVNNSFEEDTFTVLNVGKPVNSIHTELSPGIIDNENIYFSALRTRSDSTSLIESDSKTFIKIYKSTQKEGNWQEPVEADAPLNAPFTSSANLSFDPEKNVAFFVREINGRYEIFMTSKDEKSGKWLKEERLPENINLSGYLNTQPYMAKVHGKFILFFVSDRKGGIGKLDIWYAEASKEKKAGKNAYLFKEAKCLGASVNSIDNEITPFYDQVTETLYFSSDWHEGFGGYDIFKTTGNPDNLEKPVNAGLPLNSPANDNYFMAFHKESTSKENMKGYLISNRKGSFGVKGETCCNDIFYFEELPDQSQIVEVIEKDSASVGKKKITLLDSDQSTGEQQTIEVADQMKKLNKFLPLTLYFHNDEPNPRTLNTSTNLNYVTTYKGYIAMLKQYEQEYSKGLANDKAKEAVEDIDSFFNDFVEKGKQELGEFSIVLKELLEEGNSVELLVKGFASPLAKSDYNVNLSKRRISSFKNYLAEYENGFLKEYFKDGSLKIAEEPNGEYKAGNLVSDNLNDLKNSVFSRSAALERKIEVSLIKISPAARPGKGKPKTAVEGEPDINVEALPQIELPETFHDFGKVKYGEKVDHTFKITNAGKTDLIIYNAIGSCGCTIPEWTKTPIPPGKEGEIKVTFDSKGKFGKSNTTVTLITNGNPKTKTVSIAADVFIQ